MDEFEIKATSHDKPDRTWTRSTLEVAKFIADQAVENLGYTEAEVINTFGGHRSHPIYTVTPTREDQPPGDVRWINIIAYKR